MVDPISYLFNGHMFYALDTPLDHLRAWVWTASNTIVAICYFLIPFELWEWRRAMPFRSVMLTALRFVNFISACGMSHIIMLSIMPTAPWWAVPVMVWVALASLDAYFFIRLRRTLIVDAIAANAAALEGQS